MKKAQVKKLKEMIATMQGLLSEFETIRDEVQEAYDAKSDRWKESEKGEKAQEEISNLEAVDIEGTIDALSEVASQYD